MSSSVTGRFSSGSMTLPSASVICSRLGCSTCSSVAAWARETLWFLSLRAYPCFLPELSEAWHSVGCMAPSKPAMRDLPSGTVTFLFTDIEGSTRLLSELGDKYADMLAEHGARLARLGPAPRWGRGRNPGGRILHRLLV